MRDMVMGVVKQHFRAEFLNRLDDIVMFHGLTEDNLLHICKLLVDEVSKRMEGRNITIALDRSAVKLFISEAYDPAYGARPLKRVIQKNLQDPLAEELLAGRIKDGETVQIGATAGVLTFNGAPVGGKQIDPKVVKLH